VRASRQTSPPDPAHLKTADRLHSAAIHLLRRLRGEDRSSGLTGPRLSALSVVVFRGPISLGELAAAEQVRPPTITRLVHELELGGLVELVADPGDRRVRRVRATAQGRQLLRAGRGRRVARLASALARLSPDERRVVAQAAALMERLARPQGTAEQA